MKTNLSITQHKLTKENRQNVPLDDLHAKCSENAKNRKNVSTKPGPILSERQEHRTGGECEFFVKNLIVAGMVLVLPQKHVLPELAAQLQQRSDLLQIACGQGVAEHRQIVQQGIDLLEQRPAV